MMQSSTAEKSPHELLQKTKTSVESIITKMLSIKEKGNPKSENRELLTQMFLNFINLRQANRAILTEEEEVKTETESAKSPVDFTSLQLHNLLYEKSHYLKANKASRDFKSRYTNIDLISEQDFFNEAPEAIKSQTLSNDSSHDLMLKRLNFELHQRKELCKIRAKLELHKKSLVESNAERNKFLLSLPLHLKSLKKASLPVQSQLSLQNSKKLKNDNLAELLPRPLYVIYSQFMAQKEAFEENIDLEVSGSLKEAQTYARKQAEENSESLRLGIDDDGKRQRKRFKKEGFGEGGLYQVHPLKVVLHVYDDEVPDPKSRKLVVVKFEYLLKLNVVCVDIEESQDGTERNILCNLFPVDTGHEPPHQSAKLILGDDHAFDERRTSKPYKWAQHLAGIEILPEMSPLFTDKDTQNSDTAKDYASASDHCNVKTVLQRIRSQKMAKLTLVYCGKLSCKEPTSEDNMHEFLASVVCLIETLCKSLEELSNEDIVDAKIALTCLNDVSFKVDWLEKKLDQVKEKKKKKQYALVQLQETEENILKLKEKLSELDARAEELKAELLATRTLLSFNDVLTTSKFLGTSS